MSPVEIALVKESFRKLTPVADQAAALFYARLFEIDPTLRPLVHGEIMEESQRLMSTVALTVALLHRPELILPFLRDLCENSGAVQLTAGQRAHAGEALLWTLERVLGPAFTPETRGAWVNAYGLIDRTLAEAAVSATTTPVPADT